MDRQLRLLMIISVALVFVLIMTLAACSGPNSEASGTAIPGALPTAEAATAKSQTLPSPATSPADQLSSFIRSATVLLESPGASVLPADLVAARLRELAQAGGVDLAYLVRSEGPLEAWVGLSRTHGAFLLWRDGERVGQQVWLRAASMGKGANSTLLTLLANEPKVLRLARASDGRLELGLIPANFGSTADAWFLLLRVEGERWLEVWSPGQAKQSLGTSHGIIRFEGTGIAAFRARGPIPDDVPASRTFLEFGVYLKQQYESEWRREGDRYVRVSGHIVPTPMTALADFVDRLQRKDRSKAAELATGQGVVVAAAKLGLDEPASDGGWLASSLDNRRPEDAKESARIRFFDNGRRERSFVAEVVKTAGVWLVGRITRVDPVLSPGAPPSPTPTAAATLETSPRLLVAHDWSQPRAKVALLPGQIAALPLPQAGDGRACCYDVELALPKGYDAEGYKIVTAPEGSGLVPNSLATREVAWGTSILFFLGAPGTYRDGVSILGTPVPGVITLDVKGVRKPDGSLANLKFILICGPSGGTATTAPQAGTIPAEVTSPAPQATPIVTSALPSSLASALSYEDRQLCFAVEVPAGWTADGQPGAFVWFAPDGAEPRFNVVNDTPRTATSLEEAREELRGQMAPYVDGVSELAISGRPGLMYRLSADAPESYGFVAWVVAPDCYNGEHLLSIGGRETNEAEFRDFLARIRFSGLRQPVAAGLVTKQQAIRQAIEEVSRVGRPDSILRLVEARVDEAQADLMTVREAERRRNSVPPQWNDPVPRIDEPRVWWVTLRGKFRFEERDKDGGFDIGEGARVAYVLSEDTGLLIWASVGELALNLVTPTSRPTSAPASPTFPWLQSKTDEPFLTKDAAGRYLVAWADNSDNEDGFRLEVESGPGGERFQFLAPANATSYTLPMDFDFSVGRTQAECLRRHELTLRIYAFNAAGDSPLAPGGQFTVQRECFDLPAMLPRAGESTPSVEPRFGLPRNLAEGIYTGNEYQVSPDGRWLTSARNRPWNAREGQLQEMRAFDLDLDKATLLLAGAVEGYTWLPDSRGVLVAFRQSGDTLSRLERKLLGDGPAHTVVAAQNLEERFGAPVVSPDGRQLAVSVHVPALGPAPFGLTGIAVMNDDGTGRRWAVPPAHLVGPPVWTPDGKAIVYFRWKGGDPATEGDSYLVSAAADSPAPTLLLPGFSLVAWSPDGRQALWQRGTDKVTTELYVTGWPQPGTPRLVVRDASTLGAGWSADGRWIVYSGYVQPYTDVGGGGRRGVYLIASDGTGEPRLLTPSDEHAEAPVWVPGRGIAYLTGRPGILTSLRLLPLQAPGAIAGSATEPSALPAAGAHSHLIPLLAGSGLILLGAGLRLLRKRVRASVDEGSQRPERDSASTAHAA